MHYNDFVETIKNYLRHYNEWKTYIENLRQQIIDTENLIREPAAPQIPHLSHTPISNSNNDTQQDREIKKKYREIEDLALLQDDLHRIESLINALDKSLKNLSENEKKLIMWRWADHHPWKEIAPLMNMSIRNCIYKNNEAMDKIANAMFGPESTPIGKELVFYKMVK